MSRYSRSTLRLGELLALVFFVGACSAAIAFTSPDPRRAPSLPRPTSAVSRWPCAPTRPTALPTTKGPGVAQLLADHPAPGRLVEVDAYYSGAGLVPHVGGLAPLPGRARCPACWEAALTDRPFPGLLGLLGGLHSNILPAEGAWLIAAAAEAVRPGVDAPAALPFHARLRGYLGEPAFSYCPNGRRVFVVQEVVAVYDDVAPSAADVPPSDYYRWPRHSEPELGYSLPYPPCWRVERPDESTLVLRAAEWSGHPVTVQVHLGETRYSTHAGGSLPPLLQGEGWGIYHQGQAFGGRIAGQHLTGYAVDRRTLPDERTVAVLFNGGGRTYELTLRYPLGFDASQPLLTAYTAMVEGFRLDGWPGPSPTSRLE